MKLHPKGANDTDTSDYNDTRSLEACILKNRTNLPVFTEFLLSFSPLSKHDTSYSTNTSLNFSKAFWLVIQWLKTDNMTFFDFKCTLGPEKSYLLPLFYPRKLVTGNAQIDHRKYFNFFTLITTGLVVNLNQLRMFPRT